MALCWTAAGIIEAAKGFRKLKAHKQLPALRTALAAQQGQPPSQCRSCPTPKGRLVRFQTMPPRQSSTSVGTSPRQGEYVDSRT
jgi:hypothetical protein